MGQVSDTPLYDALLADRIARALAQDARRQLIADAVVAATIQAAAVVADEDAVERLPPPMPSVAELFAHNPGTSRALDALLGGASRV